MSSLLKLDGKVAFITGSTRGIGWATAQTLAANGATVVLNGHSDEKVLRDRVEELTERHHRPMDGHFFDVADGEAVKQCYQAIFKRHGRLDILVNNAGHLEDDLLGMIRPSSLERTFSVNAFGALNNLQAASRLMGRNGGGSIVNIASIMGVRGCEGQAVYAASKAAVLGLTLASAKELAPRNIRVNAIAPGYINTDLIKGLSPQKHQERLSSLKMGRIGQPEDVARVILFLASDLSSYVTGQVIGVDGGMVI